MDEQQKALEMVQKYFDLTDHMSWEQAKKSAIIAVEEILELPINEWFDSQFGNSFEYWEQVKTEIQNL